MTAIIISVVALIVSAFAAFTSTEILRVQLYNRRFNIYQATLRFYHALQQPKESYKEGTFSDRQTDFIIAVRESQFIFKSSSGIYKLLQKLDNASIKIKSTSEHGKTLMSDPQSFQKFLVETEEALQLWNTVFPNLENSMAPYLNFHYTSVIQFLRQKFCAIACPPPA